MDTHGLVIKDHTMTSIYHVKFDIKHFIFDIITVNVKQHHYNFILPLRAHFTMEWQLNCICVHFCLIPCSLY